MTSDAPNPTAGPAADAAPRPQALIGWRLLALWFLASAGFTVAFTFLGHHDPHQNIAPFSPLSWLLWFVCWTVSGLYATASWRRGGQTLGMRPWRLRLVGIDAATPGWGALWRRYAVGTGSLLLGGLGFWWALFDRDRLTWHDRASGTHLVRMPKR